MILSRLRSVLYVPGASERALEKAPSLEADAVILDLEDAVAPGSKSEARERLASLLNADHFQGRHVAVRVNAAGTPWHAEDLSVAVTAAPGAIVIPKVSSPSDIHDVERQLESLGAPDGLSLWAMLETPAAVLSADSIGASSARLSVLVVGTNDLHLELGSIAVPGREPLLVSLSLCVLGARAAGVQILDGVYNDIRDLDGFAAECTQARRFGFDGKTLIHPAQIEACNRAFSPSKAEIDHARSVIAAFTDAERSGSGVATLQGAMIEGLHVLEARRTLARVADA